MNSPERDRLVNGADVSEGSCTVADCEGAIHARGWCSRHYGLWRRTGVPTSAVERRRYADPQSAFSARTKRTESGCLIWGGYKAGNGYGLISVDGCLQLAHRYAWTVAHGSIPDAAEVDHVCGNRACCDVGHLRLASRNENMRNRAGAQSTSRTGVRNVRMQGARFRVIVNRRHVGMFDDMDSARAAAEVARNAEFGSFAGRDQPKAV